MTSMRWPFRYSGSTCGASWRRLGGCAHYPETSSAVALDADGPETPDTLAAREAEAAASDRRQELFVLFRNASKVQQHGCMSHSVPVFLEGCPFCAAMRPRSGHPCCMLPCASARLHQTRAGRTVGGFTTCLTGAMPEIQIRTRSTRRTRRNGRFTPPRLKTPLGSHLLCRWHRTKGTRWSGHICSSWSQTRAWDSGCITLPPP